MRKSWEINIQAKGAGGYRFGFKAKVAETRGNNKLLSLFPLLSRLYDFFFKPAATTTTNPKFLHRLKPSSSLSSRSKHHHHHHSKKHQIPNTHEPDLPLDPPNIKTSASINKVSRFTRRSRSLPSTTNPPEHDSIFLGAEPKQGNENSLGSSIVRSVDSLSQSIEERSASGILIHGFCVTLFACLLLMERFGILKWRSLVGILAAAVVAWGVASRVIQNVDSSAADGGDGGHGSAREAWEFAASAGSLDQLSKVIFSKIWQAIGSDSATQ